MSPLRATLVLAWRESRFARRRLLLFLSAVSLGVAALVAVESLAARMAEAVREGARSLMGADATLTSRQPFGERGEALLDSLADAGAGVARTTSFTSMALSTRTGATRLVQVRATEPGFPFYGEIETSPAGAWLALSRGDHALVDPGLLVALGADLGDTLALGEGRFLILGTLVKVPGEADVVSAFGPRVYIPASRLAATGLLGFGSRVEYEAALRLPDATAADRLRAAYARSIRDENARLRTAEEQAEALSEAMGRLWSYLRLVGTLALLLGGVGVASALAAYMAAKSDAIALLRCLGAESGRVVAVYVVQAAAMGLAGAAAGAVLGVAAQSLLLGVVAGFLPLEVRPGLHPPAVLEGLAVGLWTALAFSLPALVAARRVPPLAALRRRFEPPTRDWRDPWQWAVWTLVAASALGLILLQAESLAAGAAFAAGIVAALTALSGVAWGLERAARALSSERLPYAVRRGLGGVRAPGGRTRSVVAALGFGAFLIATLLFVQRALLSPLRADTAGARANVVLWDVQDDQAEGITELLRERGAPLLQRAPIVPMRIAQIEGRRSAPSEWAVRREYRSTYRDSLVASERIASGTWWAPESRADSSAVAPLSLEEDVAGDLRVGIGDRITWDVSGVRVPTRVASLRQVDWARFEPNFFAVFPPWALEGAPRTWVVLTRAAGPSESARLQGAVSERFPNVSALDLRQVQEALDRVLGQVSTVIRFLAAFSVGTGFLVLLGAVSTSRLERIREGVLLKTLGATRRQIAAALFVEYLVLGTAATLAGLALAAAAAWALARWFFEVDFAFPAGSLALAGAALALACAVVGVWASREVYLRTPIEALREE